MWKSNKVNDSSGETSKVESFEFHHGAPTQKEVVEGLMFPTSIDEYQDVCGELV